MPEKKTLERAREDAREGKAPSTQAGEFVREEMEHIREGKHGARSAKQAIAIGLSKARRAGVKLPPPKEGKASESTRTQAVRFANLLHAAGLLVIPAGTQILRLLPPLNLRQNEAEEGLEVIELAVERLAN